MKAIAITNKGIEDVSKQEIKELINSEAQIHDGFLTFEAAKEELIKLCYLSQSLTKVLLVDDPAKWVEGKTFAVRGKQECAEPIAAKIQGRVKLKNPDVEFYAIDEKHWGIDLSGEDLGKRDYRIFLGPESIKGVLAYALIRLAGYNPKKTLVDPFCRDGIIAIEAAIYSQKRSSHYFRKDKFNFLKLFPDVNLDKLDKTQKKDTIIYAYDPKITSINAARKNAKIAGIQKNIQFGKIRTDDLELKLKENSVDCIATIPPLLMKLAESKVIEIYKELFYQADFILSKKGKIALLTRPQRTELLKKYTDKFKLIDERSVMQGKSEWSILVFER
ncbi:methyltransferase [Candidatus Woesearchaeota archaeon]|nr:methyltransferase [Candidatus Woesearchaeota archaeon]